MANKIQIKRGVFASLPTLDSGELGWCTDTHQLYAGTNASNFEVLMQHEFDANTVLAANSNNSPAAVTISEQQVLGRLTSGNIAGVSIGIADNNMVQIDDSDAANTNYARFTANGLQGRSTTEVKQDLNLEIGTDVLAQQTIGIANDNLVEMDDTDAADNDYAKFTANGLEGRSYTEVKQDLNLEIGTDVLAQQTIGIADNNLLEVDGSPNDNEFARFTAAGLEGLTGTETMAALSGQASAAFAMNSQKITGLGTPTADGDSATKKYVDDLVTAGIFWVAPVLDKDTLAPPGGESNGDRYWIGGTGTGTWAGHDYEIAEYNGSGWDYTTDQEGMAAYVDDEDMYYYYTGSVLQALSNATGLHASTHITGGSDEIDGDKLDITYSPSNYTPSTTPSEADNLDNLTAHLYGIDQELDNFAASVHAGRHIRGGDDEIDGDKLDIDWNPSYYTPATTPAQVTNADELTAHLYGVDQEINTINTAVSGKASTSHASTHVRNGSDELDADTLNISWSPANYTPATTPTEVTSASELTAHLYGIDQELSSLGAADDFTDLGDTPGNYTSAAGKIVRVNSTPDGLEFVTFATEYLDDTPSNSDTTHAPTANWAYDHDIATTGVHGAGGNTLLHSGSTIDGGAFT